jgi:hypothetical protein
MWIEHCDGDAVVETCMQDSTTKEIYRGYVLAICLPRARYLGARKWNSTKSTVTHLFQHNKANPTLNVLIWAVHNYLKQWWHDEPDHRRQDNAGLKFVEFRFVQKVGGSKLEGHWRWLWICLFGPRSQDRPEDSKWLEGPDREAGDWARRLSAQRERPCVALWRLIGIPSHSEAEEVELPRLQLGGIQVDTCLVPIAETSTDNSLFWPRLGLPTDRFARGQV